MLNKLMVIIEAIRLIRTIFSEVKEIAEEVRDIASPLTKQDAEKELLKTVQVAKTGVKGYREIYEEYPELNPNQQK